MFPRCGERERCSLVHISPEKTSQSGLDQTPRFFSEAANTARLRFLALFLGFLFPGSGQKGGGIGRECKRAVLDPLGNPPTANTLHANPYPPWGTILIRDTDPLEIRSELTRRDTSDLCTHTSEVLGFTPCCDPLSNRWRFSADFALLTHRYQSQLIQGWR